MPNLPESVLALFAGQPRACAMMGDLTEMAETRGRGWLVAAYLRTLLSLTWRIVLALFVADVLRQFLFDLFHMYLRHEPKAWFTAGGPWLNLTQSAGPLIASIISTLWFALPFAAVRYGIRDRFVQLGAVIAFGTTIGFWLLPWISAIFVVATVGIGVAALISDIWRKAALVLAATGAAGLLVFALGNYLRHSLLVHPHSLLGRNAGLLTFQASLLTLAFVCTRLHRLLLEAPPASAIPA